MRIFSRDSDVEGEVELTVNPRCRIKFDISDSDLDKGSFGFDSYDKSKLGLLSGDLDSQYHTPADGVIFTDNYKVPWVSIRTGQTISLDIKTRFRGQPKSVIVHLDNANFTLSPTTINRDTEKISITCNTDLSVNTLLELKTNTGKVVGAINFWKNVVKTVKLEVIYVGINPGDINKMKNGIALKTKLESYLKKAFNPALIDFNIEYWDLDLTSQLINPSRGPILGKVVNLFHGNEVNDRSNFLINIETYYNTTILKDHGSPAMLERKTKVTLYLTNMESDLPSDPDSYINGISLGNISMMFLHNKYSNPIREIPHEIMHSLGLGHTFNDGDNRPTQTVFFTKFNTENYMDYYIDAEAVTESRLNARQTTYKWQWDAMHGSEYTHVIPTTSHIHDIL